MNAFDCEEMVRGLARQMEQSIVAEAMRLYYSGGIDTEKYHGKAFALPKILVTAAVHAKKDSFAPMIGDYREDLENLKRF